MADLSSSDNEIREKKVRILWDDGESVSVAYANQLYISHAGGKEFHLTFGHLAPPILFGLEEDEIPESVSIQPIAKIVVSPDAMKEFVDALNENFSKFKESEEMQ